MAAAQKANEISQIDFDPGRPLTGGVVYAPITIRLANIGVALANGDLTTALTDVDELLDYLARVQYAPVPAGGPLYERADLATGGTAG